MGLTPETASVCRTSAQTDSRIEVTGAGTVAPKDMLQLGSNPVAPTGS